MVLEPRSGVAQETAQILTQLDQQALNTLPGDERAELQVKEETGPAADALQKRSPPGKAVPIMFICNNLDLIRQTPPGEIAFCHSSHGGVFGERSAFVNDRFATASSGGPKGRR
jgi:hypothetical protein